MDTLQEFHLLHIQSPEDRHIYCLNMPTVMIGRDASNGICINDPTVSRQHAMLLRMPSLDSQYNFKIVDGDCNGRLSTNGVRINHTVCKSKILITGDLIQIGNSTLCYLKGPMTQEEYRQRFEAIKISSQKRLRSLSASKKTLIADILTTA